MANSPELKAATINWLENGMREKQLKNVDVAKYCDVQPQAVGKWLREGNISKDNIEKLKALFGAVSTEPKPLADDYEILVILNKLKSLKDKGSLSSNKLTAINAMNDTWMQ